MTPWILENSAPAAAGVTFSLLARIPEKVQKWHQNQCMREDNCLQKCPQMGFQNMLENQTQKASILAPSRAPKGDLKCIKFRLKSTLGSLIYPKMTPRCLPSGHQAPRIVKNRLKGFKKDTQHVPNQSKNTTMGPKLAPRSKTSEAQAIKSSGDQGEGPAAGAKPSDIFVLLNIF